MPNPDHRSSRDFIIESVLFSLQDKRFHEDLNFSPIFLFLRFLIPLPPFFPYNEKMLPSASRQRRCK